MNNNSQPTEAPTQGVEDSTVLPQADTGQIEKWLTRDLGACITFLTAIHNDPDLRRQMAVWLAGRIENQKNKPKVDPRQESLFGK